MCLRVTVVSPTGIFLKKRLQMALKRTLKYICLVRDYNTATEYSGTLRSTRLPFKSTPVLWTPCSYSTNKGCKHYFRRIKKSGSTLKTIGFVIRPKIDPIWSFGTMAATAAKYSRDFSEFSITIRAGDLNDRKDWREDNFSPGEVVLV